MFFPTFIVPWNDIKKNPTAHFLAKVHKLNIIAHHFKRIIGFLTQCKPDLAWMNTKLELECVFSRTTCLTSAGLSFNLAAEYITADSNIHCVCISHGVRLFIYMATSSTRSQSSHSHLLEKKKKKSNFNHAAHMLV